MPAPNELELRHWLRHSGYRHACFVSWPHSMPGPKRHCVERIRAAIEEEARGYGLPPSVFIDQQGIAGGDDWIRQIEQALCHSIAMIAVCGPDYYESDYCGREWTAMEEIGRARIDGEKRFIIPLIWKPARSAAGGGLSQDEFLPEPVRARQYTDLSRIRVRSRNVESTREFESTLVEILKQIEALARALEQRQARAGACDTFRLPATSAFAGYKQAALDYPFSKALR